MGPRSREGGATVTPVQSFTVLLVALSILGLLAATIVLFLFLARRGCVMPEPVRPDDGEFDA